MNSKNHQQYNVKVLGKLTKILDLFTYTENLFTLEQISKKTHLSKATAFRILKTLEQYGFFTYNPVEETYTLGLRFLELGGIVYASLSIRNIVSPHMETLGHSLRATVLLGIIKDDHLFYIDKRESESIIRVSSYVGLKRPPYYGMLGMTLLAYMEDEEKQRLLTMYKPYKITEKTITDIEKLKQKLDEIKRLGYCLERSTVIEGVIGLGVPIRDFSGKVVAALGVTLPEFQMKEKDIKRAIGEMLDASQAISRKLGHNAEKQG